MELSDYIHYHQLKYCEVRHRETEYPIDHRHRVAFPRTSEEADLSVLKSERALQGLRSGHPI